MHSAKCDAAIPGEEQLLSIPYREFVAFRFSRSTDLVVKLFQGTFNHVAYSMTGLWGIGIDSPHCPNSTLVL